MQTRYPLLIKGYTCTQAAVGAITRNTFVFEKKRGNVMFIDPVPTKDRGNNFFATISVLVGGVDVITNSPTNNHLFDAWPNGYVLTAGDYKGGQTFDTILNNFDGTAVEDMRIHVYHENPYLTPGWMKALHEPFLGLKSRAYQDAAPAATKDNSFAITLPKNQGNIVAIRPFVLALASTTTTVGTMTVMADGVEIIKDASSAIFDYRASRPMTILPIDLPRACDLVISYDNTNGAAALEYGVEFFFAGDKYGHE